MGFAHFILIAVVFVGMVAGFIALCALAMHIIETACNRLLPKARAERWVSRATGAVVVVALLSFVTLLITTVVRLPDEAELRVLLSKAVTYESSRIRIDLNDASEQERQDLIQLLTPMMQEQALEVRYRVASRHRSYWVKATLPTYYRVSEDSLEIATGRALESHQNTPMYMQILERAAMAPDTQRLPARLDAEMVLRDGEPIAVGLLPGSVALTVAEPKSMFAQSGMPMTCRLEIQGLVSTDYFNAVFRSGVAGVSRSARLKVPAAAGAPAREFEIRALAAVPGARGRLVKELPEDRTQIYVRLQLVPLGMSAEGQGCDVRLFNGLDRPWVVAALHNLSPLLTRVVRQASLERSVRYSPWYAAGSWTPAALVEPGK
ncbi:hypothetical protein RAS12_20225 [Achromobacter seleniivolatilans]|uniref:Uncharacterized protein n=1 Tax=Achromobacter seleniivolatilans TaxID=3047478 RepID=A0ABY9LVX5_9BURK|nr:hypothetical protein [Achromobacter sp. R39]WMD18938.1 hypothetical protein RAS12_20225 [Achromobacter sp. R39]